MWFYRYFLVAASCQCCSLLLLLLLSLCPGATDGTPSFLKIFKKTATTTLSKTRCQRLVSIALKGGDHSGFETLTLLEREELLKPTSPEKNACTAHSDGVRDLLQMVDTLQVEAHTLYETHKDAIEELLSEVAKVPKKKPEKGDEETGGRKWLKGRRWLNFAKKGCCGGGDEPSSATVDATASSGTPAAATASSVEQPPLPVGMPRSVTEVLERYRGNHPVREAIRASKLHILKLFSPGRTGLAYFVRVHKFIEEGVKSLESAQSSQRGPFVPLARIYEVAKLQCGYLDEEIFDHSVELHFERKKREEGGASVIAFTLGGGPAGLWATRLAFEAGFNSVNAEKYKRGEYKRKRAIRLDSIWLEQLRWWLGTMFDRYTSNVNSPWPVIYINNDLHCLYVDIYRFENMLHDRLKALIDHLEKRRKENAEKDEKAGKNRLLNGLNAAGGEGSAARSGLHDDEKGAKLELLERAEVKKLLFPGALLDDPLDEHAHTHFRALIHEYPGRKNPKPEKPKVLRYQKFGVFLNSGGATNNTIRHIYSGTSVPQTGRKAYFVAVAERSDSTPNLLFNMERFFVTKDSANLPTVADLKRFMLEHELNAIIQSFEEPSPTAAVRSERPSSRRSWLTGKSATTSTAPAKALATSSAPPSANVKSNEQHEWCRAEKTMQKYRNLGTRLAGEPNEAKVYVVAVFNQFDCLRVAGMPPDILTDFNNSLLDEMEELGWEKKSPEAKPCYRMRDRVNNYFFRGVFKMVAQRSVDRGLEEEVVVPENANFINVDEHGMVIENEEGTTFVLKLESNNLNKQVFNVVQSKLPVGATYYIIGGKIMIIDVLSDALVDPHFASTSGMTTGRRGVEDNIAILAEDYPSWSETTPKGEGLLTEEVAKAIVDKQNNMALNPTKEDTLLRGRSIMKGLVIEDVNKLKELGMEQMLRFINSLSKEKSRRVVKGKGGAPKPEEEPIEFDFAIECLPPKETNGQQAIGEPATQQRGEFVMIPTGGGFGKQIDTTGVLNHKVPKVCVSAEQPNFKLHLHGGDVVEAYVTSDGRVAVWHVDGHQTDGTRADGRRSWWGAQGFWQDYSEVGKAAAYLTQHLHSISAGGGSN